MAFRNNRAACARHRSYFADMKVNLIILMLAAAVAGVATANAQGPRGAERNLGPKTVETVQGRVVSITETAPRADRGFGVHLALQGERETILVHLGPRWFLEKRKPQLKAGDAVTVKGSRVTMNGKPVLLAAEITKGNEVLKLRDANGRPNWAGGPS
jgi:hypothetical protein